jgi:hypothetical protein
MSVPVASTIAVIVAPGMVPPGIGVTPAAVISTLAASICVFTLALTVVSAG